MRPCGQEEGHVAQVPLKDDGKIPLKDCEKIPQRDAARVSLKGGGKIP